MFSRYLLQLCQCSLMPVNVEDSQAHLLQHLWDMVDCAKVRGECSMMSQLPPPSTTLAMINMAGLVPSDRHCMSCGWRMWHVVDATSKFSNH